MRNVLETLPRSVIWVRMNNAQIFAVEEHEKIFCWFWQQSKTETLSPLKTFYLHSSQQVHWSCIRITNNAQYLWREKHQYVFFLWLVQPVYTKTGSQPGVQLRGLGAFSGLLCHKIFFGRSNSQGTRRARRGVWPEKLRKKIEFFHIAIPIFFLFDWLTKVLVLVGIPMVPGIPGYNPLSSTPGWEPVLIYVM